MFKVSFKENTKFPVKKVQRFNDAKITIVTLVGVLELPKFLQYFIPDAIWDWLSTCKNVETEITMSKMYLIIKGKARRADNDAENAILGERIAECRAKINLYKFMFKFCAKIHKYYYNILFGKVDKTWVGEKAAKDDTVAKARGKYYRLLNSEQQHLNKLLAHEPDTESSQEH